MALWTPDDITTSLWLDAADSDTITLESGAVAQWADKSGNARHAGQSTSELRPALLEDQLNGHAAVGTGGGKMLHTAAFAGTAAVSLFLVNKTVSAPVAYPVPYCYGGINDQFSMVVYSSTGETVWRKGVAEPDAIFDTSSSWEILNGESADGTSRHRIFVNAAIASVATRSSDLSTGAFSFGIGYPSGNANHASDNLVGEMLLLPALPDDSLRQKIEGYLAHKWGLELGLPSDHPYKSAAPEFFSLSGTITDRFGQPCQRKVYAVSRPTDTTAPQILAHGLSDATTGVYSLIVSSADEITRVVVSEDDDDPLLNDIVDRVIPA